WASQLDDLRLLRRQIVARVIAQSAGADVDPAVDAYLAARVDPYQRLARLIESTAGATDDASVGMVMVHQIRQVVAEPSSPARPARTCCSMRRTPWSGIRGGTRRWSSPAAPTGRACRPSATRARPGCARWPNGRSQLAI